MRASRDYFDDVSDEELQRRMKQSLSPDLLEWLKRSSTDFRDVSTAPFANGAQFNFAMGVAHGQQALIEALEEMLSTASDPEKHFDNES